MTKIYNGCTKIRFTASHKAKFKKKCADNQKHKHRWKVYLYVESIKLNKEFVAVDCNILENLRKKFHKTYLNELPAFKNKIPTMEVIGDWFVDNIPECYQATVYEGRMWWKFWDKKQRYYTCYETKKKYKDE